MTAEGRGAGPERSSDVLQWGILSTANIGRAAVIPAIQASHNGRVAAVASREPDRARTFAQANGIPVAHGSYEALLEDPSMTARDVLVKVATELQTPLSLSTACAVDGVGVRGPRSWSR